MRCQAPTPLTHDVLYEVWSPLQYQWAWFAWPLPQGLQLKAAEALLHGPGKRPFRMPEELTTSAPLPLPMAGHPCSKFAIMAFLLLLLPHPCCRSSGSIREGQWAVVVLPSCLRGKSVFVPFRRYAILGITTDLTRAPERAIANGDTASGSGQWTSLEG
jgi:hypothetical protein